MSQDKHFPIHESVKVSSATVVDILKFQYGITVSPKLVTAWCRAEVLPSTKAGGGKKSGILVRVGDLIEAADSGTIPPRARKTETE